MSDNTLFKLGLDKADRWFEIVNTDDYYRFVNHYYKILTTGFKARTKLIEYKDFIRFDVHTNAIMQTRYLETFK